MARPNNRAENALRPVDIIPHYTEMAPGSVLIECGRTRVICTASVEESVPPFLKGAGKGWLTAEYAMLPGSTDRRKQREYGKRDGRSVEIQRLIGRSLRACCDLTRMGERTIYLDCDVIQADGGTRTASITGGFVALHLALQKLRQQRRFYTLPLFDTVSAISCGIYDGTPVLDLDYVEDSNAQTDSNFVITGKGGIVEIQGTAERAPFTPDQFKTLYELACKGTSELAKIQHEALGE